MLCLQLLQGIVRPLKSAHQTSAIQRSRSAADIVLQAKGEALSSNGSTNQVSSLQPHSSEVTSVPTSGSNECSSSSAEAQTEKKRINRKTELDTNAGTTAAQVTVDMKKRDLLNRKKEIVANAHSSRTADAQIAVDLNENVIASGQVPHAVPSLGKSGEVPEKANSVSTKPSNATKPSLSSSTVDQNVSSASTSTESSFSQTSRSGLGDGAGDSMSSQAGTRSWVSSSSYRQKLGSHAASRYQSVTSRLYGDDWLSSLSNRAGKRSTSNTLESASDTAPLSANSSDESQSNKSQSKTTAESPASSSSSDYVPADADSKLASSSLHYVYSCSTSKHTTLERPSLTSDSGDDDDDNTDDEDNSDKDEDDDDDGDDGAGGTADVASFGLETKHNDSMQKTDKVRWRHRLVASPPPRRAAHASRRFEDHDKELAMAGTDGGQGRSVQSNSDTLGLPESPKSPESLKHVSFDPFTLSLNAALEGELDVLQSLLSQVSLL